LTGGNTDQQVMVALLGPSPFGSEPAATSPAPDMAAAQASPPQTPVPVKLAQAPANEEGVPTSRGAGLASAALAAPDEALQEIPAGLIESLSQAPNAGANLATSALPPAASDQPPAALAQPPAALAQPPAALAQPRVIGAGSVTDSLPVVIPQTAGATPRVTEALRSTVSVAAAPSASQPTRILKPLPPPLPAGFEVRNPSPVDTGGLGRSLGPLNAQHVDTAAVPAAMTRALDSYRKMMQDRSREAVPVPGLDFQS
jgi:hypothetical protein